MEANLPERNFEEEQIVTELANLGVGYLSFSTDQSGTVARAAASLLADLIRQPSSRVRTAIIPLLIAHPRYAAEIRQAHSLLAPGEARLLELLYTAAVYLQKKYQTRITPVLGETYPPLPDLFSQRLLIPSDLPVEQSLARLAERHREITGLTANWVGTYENAVHHWLHRKEKEQTWSQ